MTCTFAGAQAAEVSAAASTRGRHHAGAAAGAAQEGRLLLLRLTWQAGAAPGSTAAGMAQEGRLLLLQLRWQAGASPSSVCTVAAQPDSIACSSGWAVRLAQLGNACGRRRCCSQSRTCRSSGRASEASGRVQCAPSKPQQLRDAFCGSDSAAWLLPACSELQTPSQQLGQEPLAQVPCDAARLVQLPRASVMQPRMRHACPCSCCWSRVRQLSRL